MKSIHFKEFNELRDTVKWEYNIKLTFHSMTSIKNICFKHDNWNSVVRLSNAVIVQNEFNGNLHLHALFWY